MQDIEADIASIAKIDAVPTLLEVVCRSTGMGFAAVARVTEDRWVACSVRDEIAFGLEPGGELDVSTTLCDEIRDHHRPIVIDHVACDPVFCSHPTPAMYGIQSYISVPIVLPDGDFFGTLCAVDPEPKNLSRVETLGMFKLFAELLAFHVHAQRSLEASAATLLTERQTAELREQFIAVLGHDLRNPLSAIEAGTEALLRTPLDERAKPVIGRIQRSAARIAGLIDDVLDFARGRLGGGFPIQLEPEAGLGELLEQVVEELQVAHADRIIEARITLSDSVACDRTRIAQLLSNLIANALLHGRPEAPVRVQASSLDGTFELSVANAGEPIPDAVLKDLFKPFFRAALRPSRNGLGLGLYIAAEIARAHGGSLEVTSSPDETLFIFRMPRSASAG